MTLSVRRLTLGISSLAALIACFVTSLWVARGYHDGVLFAILFAIGSVSFLVASLIQDRAPVVAALVTTVIAEYEPIGGVVAGAILKQPVAPGVLIPVAAGFVGIIGGLAVLLIYRAAQRE